MNVLEANMNVDFFVSNQREDSQDTLSITVKIHQGAVYCCCFSQDASKVVSCGTDKTVKARLSICHFIIT